MEIETGKYYKIKKNGRLVVGKCLKASQSKSKFEIVFDESDKLKGMRKWYTISEFESIKKIEDGNIVLELLK